MEGAVALDADGDEVAGGGGAGDGDEGAGIEHEYWGVERFIGLDFEVSEGTGDGAEIATGIFNLIGHAGPGGELVSGFQTLDGRQVDGGQGELAALEAAGDDVVIDTVGQTGEEKVPLIDGAIDGHHGDFLPLLGLVEAGKDAD